MRPVAETSPIRPASAAQPANLPRLAEARGSLKHGVTLAGAFGAPAGRSLSQVVSVIGARGDGPHGRRQCQWADGRDPGPPLRRVQGRRCVGWWGHSDMTKASKGKQKNSTGPESPCGNYTPNLPRFAWPHATTTPSSPSDTLPVVQEALAAGPWRAARALQGPR